MATSATPPSFYANVAAMNGGGAPGGKPSPAGAEQKNPDNEIIQGFAGIFRVMAKMEKLAEKVGKPELREKFGPISEMFKTALVDVFKVDPKQVMPPEEAPEGAVEGNKSPQGVPDASPPPPDQTAPQVPA
jgi:hypothetical protein